MANWLTKIGNAIKGVANVAAMIPGPWQVPAQVISAIGAATSKKKNPANQTQQYLQQGADSQMAYQREALAQYKQQMDKALQVSTADKQSAYDISRGQYQANQQNMLPYQTASLGALQTLPQLQQLLGLQAYNIPQNISQYTPPEVNYEQMYGGTSIGANPASVDNGMVATADGSMVPVPAGPRGNPVMAPVEGSMRPGPDGTLAPVNLRGEQGAVPNVGNTGTTSNTALEAYTGPAYDMENSPIFKWQQQIANEGLTNQLSAAGLSGGTYAQRELNRSNMNLAAGERDRVVGNMQQMVGLGMQGAQLGQANFTPPQAGNLANMYGEYGQNLGQFYGNMGAIQGQFGSQSAQNQMAGMNAQAQQPSGWQTALEMANQYGWLGGGKKTSKPGALAGMGSWTGGGIGGYF